MNFQTVLDEIDAEIRPLLGAAGTVAAYIPALARVPAERFGIALRTHDGEEACAGDARTPFSIQSVSKLFTLTLAMRCLGDRLWERIGREPSGNPFNSLVQLEFEAGRPRNPFINAGALAVADRLVTQARAGACGDGPRDARDDLLALMSDLAGEAVAFDAEVAASEAATGFRNVALVNFMKSFGKIDNDVADVLDMYFHQCAIRMSCAQLARAAGFLCRDGAHPLGRGRATGGGGGADAGNVVTDRQARRINALMLTCGTYDAAGDVAFSIGLPCKSGVGGGIVAVVPDRLTLCVWSPALDAAGNSLLGLKALELFVGKTGLSVF
ncbi:MAG TPA: glutaminase [Variovorax sp.]|nr:glutaminase [Variovorax sp.]